MIIAGIAIIFAGLYWFLIIRTQTPEIVEEIPTPTPTQTSTPPPSAFDKLGSIEEITIPSTSVFSSSLTSEMSTRQPVTGQIRLYSIVDENQQKYSFKDFLIKLNIDTSLLNSEILDTEEWTLGVYGQLGASQNTSMRPFIVLVQNDSTSTTSLMNIWEPKLITDLSSLFNLTDISTNLSFTPDIYSNINFRFIRIPDRDLGVAYAVFQNYLVFASSRDSFRAIIDALTTL